MSDHKFSGNSDGTLEQTAADALDAVIWQALTGAQRRFAEGDDLARRYPAAVAPFAAVRETASASYDSLLRLVHDEEEVALFTVEAVEPPPVFQVTRRAPVDQMVLRAFPPRSRAADARSTPLSTADVPEMLDLVARTKPGPFGIRTIELGQYIGRREGGRLVAMAGERMRIDGFTEISAVCVDPDYRGRGLGVDVMEALIGSIIARSDVPFLHVFSTNDSAIALYRKLGFVLRRRLHLAVLRRDPAAR